MSDILKQTIRIKRGDKVGTDDQGHSVWTKPVDTIELELVSTTVLQRILESDDDKKKERIKSLANEGDGVLAKTPGTDNFEVISDEELAMALEAVDQDADFVRPADVVLEPMGSTADAEELSLVSTQALRRILHPEDEDSTTEPEGLEMEGSKGGYNPYDSG